ncbi:hypothetical protein BSKO_10356 [Bryopsis sp. KO-2023]|nr:hypothetical protein BSKO_10356 [Bryopsis sp. KO-2023]
MVKKENSDAGLSLHGESAARRQAITELLFFASVGDLGRCQKLVDIWGLELKRPQCCDYDKRTSLHLAAAEGCYSVVEWLIKEMNVDPSPVDRFKRTPLEDAVHGDHREVATLLMDNGAQVVDKEGKLSDLSDSHLSMNLRLLGEVADDWEIDPKTLKLIEKIGEGEFGVVHKAMWHGTLVAVKVLKSSSGVAVGDFKTELNVLQKCHHPHTVQFLGAVTREPPFMIVTEYMNGGSLADIFSSNILITIRRAVEIAIDTARGMAYLHNKNQSSVCIIHRDLKPANLMIGGHRAATREMKQMMVKETGVVKIADFGLSRSIAMRLYRRHGQRDVPSIHTGGVDVTSPSSESEERRSLSYKMTGETGSYRYMAPEVFRHETYNEKVDVYAFAMIFYFLLEGVPPYFSMDPLQAARSAALNKVRPQWRDANQAGEVVPENIIELVEECWAAEFDARPDFITIISRLDAIGASLEVQKKTGCCGMQ